VNIFEDIVVFRVLVLHSFTMVKTCAPVCTNEFPEKPPYEMDCVGEISRHL
jgi:hypothetical protein